MILPKIFYAILFAPWETHTNCRVCQKVTRIQFVSEGHRNGYPLIIFSNQLTELTCVSYHFIVF